MAARGGTPGVPSMRAPSQGLGQFVGNPKGGSLSPPQHSRDAIARRLERSRVPGQKPGVNQVRKPSVPFRR